MLHLRVIAPAGLTAKVRAALVEEPGATHVTVLQGVAVQPAGDVVEADVTREAVDDVLVGLKALGVDRVGGVTLETIDTTLSVAADEAEKAVPGDPVDAVIWEELVVRTGEDSRLSWSFQAFLTIACLLAAIGAVTNSPVTVVGAMVLGPEFGPLAAVAVGMVLRRGDLVRSGALALVAGFPLAMLVTAAAAVLFTSLGLITTARPRRWRPGRLHLLRRLVLPHRRAARGRGGHARVDLGQVGLAGRGVHLGDDRARGGLRRGRRRGGPLGPGRELDRPAGGQPAGHRRRRGGRPPDRSPIRRASGRGFRDARRGNLGS